jgi:hypothetical protein
MNIDELRNIIWEHLFRAKASKSIDEIAALTDRDATAVRAAVDHEWFNVRDERVSIAYAAPTQTTIAS